jgi:hypothetical protein
MQFFAYHDVGGKLAKEKGDLQEQCQSWVMGMSSERDKIYRKTPLNEIPWNIDVPPNQLVELVDSG